MSRGVRHATLPTTILIATTSSVAGCGDDDDGEPTALSTTATDTPADAGHAGGEA